MTRQPSRNEYVTKKLELYGITVCELYSSGTLKISMLEKELNQFLKKAYGTSKFDIARSIRLSVPTEKYRDSFIEIQGVKRIEPLQTNTYFYSFSGKVLKMSSSTRKFNKNTPNERDSRFIDFFEKMKEYK